ncbi:MAG: hypothetical protein AAFZ18_08435 [Myxococcota bacterium]
MTRLVSAAVGLLLLVASTARCSPASMGPRETPPPEKRAFPAVVKGATLRAVGDDRRGYGTRTARQTMNRLRDLGVNTIGVLLQGRMTHGQSDEVMGASRGELAAVGEALDDARDLGFATVLVPHLYIDDGTWRGYVSFKDPKRAKRWWETYADFVGTAAALGEAHGASALSVGVELKAMSSDPLALVRMGTVVSRVREIYGGLLTYSANWDEAENVTFWSLVDLVGVNGYYPLVPTPERGAEQTARRLRALAESTGKEVLVVEVGYRSSPLSYVRPWEWPEQIEAQVDEASQAKAWAAVLTHWLPAPGVRGLMAWVIPTDPDDPASEPRHGFNPLNKQAEQVLAEAFRKESPTSASR